MRKIVALFVALTILVFALPAVGPIYAKGGKGSSTSKSAGVHAKAGKPAKRAVKHRATNKAAIRAARRSAAKALRQEAKAERKRKKELRKSDRFGAKRDDSATAPPKLRGRENAFNRIVSKLWRMPDSALKGLYNALANIGKWIGLVPPQTPPAPPGETTGTPEPTTTPEPTVTP